MTIAHASALWVTYDDPLSAAAARLLATAILRSGEFDGSHDAPRDHGHCVQLLTRQRPRRGRVILNARRPASSRSKPVTHAAHGLEQVSLWSEFASQRADGSLDDVAAFVVGLPDGAEDLLAAGHCAGVGEEELCQRELDPGQRYPPAVDD